MKVKKFWALTLTLFLLMTNISFSAFAAESDATAYGQVILMPAEGTTLLTTDGKPLETILVTLEGQEGYWYPVGERLDFVIEVDAEYRLMFETFDNASGGGGVSYDETLKCYYGYVEEGENTIQTWSRVEYYYDSSSATLYQYNDSTESYSDAYYPIVLHDHMGQGIELEEGTYTELRIGGYAYWCRSGQEVSWHSSNNDGYIPRVQLTKTVDGETVTSMVDASGSIIAGSLIDLKAVPYCVFEVDSPNAVVEVIEGLTDLGDGTYGSTDPTPVELKITADEGYNVKGVRAVKQSDGDLTTEELEGEYAIGTFDRDTGTWKFYLEFEPDTIVVSTYCVFEVDSPNATVEVIQGLEDLGDGTYGYKQTEAVELKITADEGYKITEVKTKNQNEQAAYISASGTWLLTPSFVPDTIVVSAEKLTDSAVTIVGGTGSTEVTVQIPAEDAEKIEGLALMVEELDEAVEEKAVSLVVDNLGVEENHVYILDIYFEDANGERSQVNATMTVTVPILEGWDPANVSVYYVNPDTGEMTDMKALVSADGKTATFTTDHFSYYALVQKTASETVSTPMETTTTGTTTTPQTGDNSNIGLWIALLAVSCGELAALLLVSKKRNCHGKRVGQ